MRVYGSALLSSHLQHSILGRHLRPTDRRGRAQRGEENFRFEPPDWAYQNPAVLQL